MLLESSEQISPVEAVLGVVNGMVGVLVVLLPVYALEAGYVSTLLSIVISGSCCAFSSWIYLQHLGEEPDIGHALKKHFRGSFCAKLAYDIAAWAFLIIVCIEYFQLIVIQWEIVVPSTVSGNSHLASCLINGLFMLALVLVLKYWEIGAMAMVYGIISIAIYLFYLIWVLASEPAHATNPETVLRPFGSGMGAVKLTAAMGQGFMIQVFLVPFLQKLRNSKEESKNFTTYTSLSYLIGGLTYLYIAQAGSFGIVHRSAMWPVEVYGILAYLPSSWELDSLCIVYTLHLYSVLPQYLLISKRILFENLEFLRLQETSRRDINWHEAVYILLVVGVAVVLAAIDVPLEYLMAINGGIIGTMIMYLLPAVLHLYCMLCVPPRLRQPFSEDSRHQHTPNRTSSEIEINFIHLTAKPASERSIISADSPPNKASKSMNKASKSMNQTSKSMNMKQPLIEWNQQDSRIEHSYVQCECDHYQRPAYFKWGMGSVLVGMMAFGVFVMVEAIKDTFENDTP